MEISTDGHIPGPDDQILQRWDRLLRDGLRVAAVGGSDAHTVTSEISIPGIIPLKIKGHNEDKLGRSSRTFVHHPGPLTPGTGFRSNDSEDPVRKAIFNGATVASNGPQAAVSLDGTLPGGTLTTEADRDMVLQVGWKPSFVQGKDKGAMRSPDLVRVFLSSRFPLPPLLAVPDFYSCRALGQGDDCYREYELSREEQDAGRIERVLRLPKEVEDAYVRVEVLYKGRHKGSGNGQYEWGAYTSPIFIHQADDEEDDGAPDAIDAGPEQGTRLSASDQAIDGSVQAIEDLSLLTPSVGSEGTVGSEAIE
jgi:hypothetical protein